MVIPSRFEVLFVTTVASLSFTCFLEEGKMTRFVVVPVCAQLVCPLFRSLDESMPTRLGSELRVVLQRVVRELRFQPIEAGMRGETRDENLPYSDEQT